MSSLTKPFSSLSLGASASSATSASLLTQSQSVLSALSPSLNTTGVAFHTSVFHSHLTTALLGRSFLLLPVTDSTMNVSRQLAALGSVSGALVLAERQTAGRGRGDGRVWASEPKGNLYFTVLLEPLAPSKLPLINFALPLAVVKACEAVGVRSPRVKWPNDVWVDGRKLSGMLVDIDQSAGPTGAPRFLVHCGVGVNVNEEMSGAVSDEIRAVATSVREHLPGRAPASRELMLAVFCNELERRLLSCATVADILPEYEKYDLLRGEAIVVMPKKREDPASHYEAKCAGYTADGFMRVRVEKTGEEKVLVSEEVSVRTALAYYEEKEREKKKAAAEAEKK